MDDMMYPGAPLGPALGRADSDPRQLSRLIYRSRATAQFDPRTLPRLVKAAQGRNRAEGLTGAMVYDGGRFVQWLEGPRSALDSVVASIRSDPRHDRFEVLRDRSVNRRSFAAWTMMLATRDAEEPPGRDGTMRAPAAAIDALLADPDATPGLLRDLFGATSGAADAEPGQEAAQRAHTVDALIALVTSARGEVTADRIEALCHHAQGVEAFAALYDETAKALGELWLARHCSAADIATALSALQTAYRRLRLHALPSGRPRPEAGRALVAQMPGDPHVLGAILKADLLRVRGWRADMAFSDSPEGLAERLSARPYDALVLATSRVLPNPRHLPGIAALIAQVRAAAPAPGPIMVVGGRAFAAGDTAWRDVGADAACATPADLAGLLDSLRAARR